MCLYSSDIKKSDMTSDPSAPPSKVGVTKRADYLSWEQYFMSVAFLSAQRSKDPNSQVDMYVNTYIYMCMCMHVRGRVFASQLVHCKLLQHFV